MHLIKHAFDKAWFFHATTRVPTGQRPVVLIYYTFNMNINSILIIILIIIKLQAQIEEFKNCFEALDSNKDGISISK